MFFIHVENFLLFAESFILMTLFPKKVFFEIVIKKTLLTSLDTILKLANTQNNFFSKNLETELCKFSDDI